VSRVVLYRNLFPSELEQNKHLSVEQLREVFINKFPEEVVEVQNIHHINNSVNNTTNPEIEPQHTHIVTRVISEQF
jgi:hypothetical protein